MTEKNQSILKSISFADISKESIDELQRITKKLPYFSLAQLWLSKKMHQQNDENYLLQAQKAALYFSNPFWFHYQFLNSSNKNIPTKEIEEDLIKQDVSIEPVEVKPLAQPESRLEKILGQQAEDFKKPIDENAQLEIESTPSYTNDYFASQGIQLEAEPQDKLTNQVQRFTDWLKQMKRINTQEPADLGTDIELEKNVELTAETSNETKEIITEAMADVLVQQGKTSKAIELYVKLSFLNPQKTAYFASKIDGLKNK